MTVYTNLKKSHEQVDEQAYFLVGRIWCVGSCLGNVHTIK
jgi:hypothetical protein